MSQRVKHFLLWHSCVDVAETHQKIFLCTEESSVDGVAAAGNGKIAGAASQQESASNYGRICQPVESHQRTAFFGMLILKMPLDKEAFAFAVFAVSGKEKVRWKEGHIGFGL